MRTSDTGEDGFELMVAPAVAQHILETLQAAGVRPAGFSAQEETRVEACIPAYVPDLEVGLTPAEADLDVLLDLPGGHAHRQLAALLLDGEAVPSGTPLTSASETVGEVRSCLRTSGLNATIALGMIDARYAFPGRDVQAGDVPAHVVVKPFLRRRATP
jgi:aminomethyltransferase